MSEAVKLLASLGEDAKLLAGGHSLLPMMKLRLAQPAHLIDLGRIADAEGHPPDGAEIVIGAMTTEHESSARLCSAKPLPLLAKAAKVDRRPAGALQGHASAATSPTAIPATTCRR